MASDFAVLARTAAQSSPEQVADRYGAPMRIDSIVLHVQDLQRASRFWSQALDYRLREEDSTDAGVPVLIPRHGAGPALTLDTDDRTHLDLHTDSETEQLAQVERLISLGAQRVEWSYGPEATHVVLADPDGNLFCVIRRAPAEPTADGDSQP